MLQNLIKRKPRRSRKRGQKEAQEKAKAEKEAKEKAEKGAKDKVEKEAREAKEKAEHRLRAQHELMQEQQRKEQELAQEWGRFEQQRAEFMREKELWQRQQRERANPPSGLCTAFFLFLRRESNMWNCCCFLPFLFMCAFLARKSFCCGTYILVLDF